MRLLAAALISALAACSPPSAPAEPPPQGAAAGSSGAGRVEAPTFTLASEAVVGQWSFDRSCGLYDLVFSAGGVANYYDYADESHVVSYAGRWAAADHNRVVMTLRRLGGDGAPSGEALTYIFDVSDPVTDDLVGRFGQAESDMRNITAKRCPEEDRE
jgi:hypothetical protein